MKSALRYSVIVLGLCLPVVYTNCRLLDPSTSTSSTKSVLDLYGTNTGNPKPTDGCQQILEATCSVLQVAHSGLDFQSCREGVLSTSLINNLGVPEKVLNPYYSLCSAEQAGAIRASTSQLAACVSAIRNLDPLSNLVKSAYNSSLFNPFVNVMYMIPSSPDQCGQVFKDNTFQPPDSISPPPGTVVVDFDNPVPGPINTTLELEGIYQGIEFTHGVWNWSLPFDASTTNFAVNSAATTGDTGFSFSGGPKILKRMKVFAPHGDIQLTVYDDLGQRHTQLIPHDQKMHLVTLNFPKASSQIYFHRESSLPEPHRSAGLGFDEIIYEIPQLRPSIAQVQSQYALWDRTNLRASATFYAPNTQGNLIVALVRWKGNARLQSVTDLAGNNYTPASSVGSLLTSNQYQQIWYASNVQKFANKNKVTATFTNSKEVQELYIQEYSGLIDLNPVEISFSLNGNGKDVSSGLFQIPSSNQLLFTAVIADQYNATFPADFTTRPYFGLTPHADKVISSAGSQEIQATLPIDTNWNLQVVSFKGKNEIPDSN